MSPGARRGDLAILAGVAALRLALCLAFVHGYGIFRDELYYLACASHLDFGYVDHPPLSIALLEAWRTLFGDGLLALRFLPALAGAATVFLTGVIARELGGARSAQVLAALAAFFTPYFLAVSHFYSLNAFDVLIWTGLLLLAVRILRTDRPRLWLWFGALAGLGLENKYTLGALGLGLAVGLALTAQRRRLRSPHLWAGAAVALALLAPNLIWQAAHGTPTLEFMRNAAALKNAPVTPLEFLGGQLVLVHPLLAPLWLIGLGALLFDARFAAVRALGVAYLALLALMMFAQAKVYYLAPIYPVLFAAGCVELEAFFARRGWRFAPAAVGVWITAAGVAALPMTLPVLPPETFIAYSRAIGVGEPQMERMEKGRLPQIYADMFGWRELADEVARVWRELPEHERARAVVLGRNYGEAGAIDHFGPALGLPRAISPHNSYWLWGTGDWDGGVVILIGEMPQELLESFASVERRGLRSCALCQPYESELPISVARGLRVPVSELWARYKRFI